MKELVRCKACGYIMEKSALRDVCPACGVKKEMFEPWEDKVGALRRLILDRHIHPVIVHAPQALAFLLLFLGASYPLVSPGLQAQYVYPAITVMTWLFPFSIVVTILSGFFDAMVRYRRVATPALLRKQILGYFLLAASAAMTVLVAVNTSFGDLAVWLGFVAANLVAMGCSALLGILGSTLTHAAMPGDKIFMKKKKPAAKAPAKPAAPKAEEKKD